MTVGSYEVVTLPELGLSDIIAKIDTGAYSGAVHCTDIRLEQRGTQQILCFLPAGNQQHAYETEDFKVRKVRSSNGHMEERYLIGTTICLAGKTYPITIGLSDRSDMRKQILIGRRFLREQKMLVDVSLNTEYDDQGEIS